MINSLIDQIKLEYEVPIYKPENISRLQDSEIAFTISDRLFLETMILRIRGETIKYSTINKKRCKAEETLKKEIERFQHSEDNNVDLQAKKCELENIRAEKQKGVIIRSRVQWLHEGEKPVIY